MTKENKIKELKELLEDMKPKVDYLYTKQNIDKLKEKKIDDIKAHNNAMERILNGENKLKVYREYRGLSRHQLAEKSGTSYYNICSIEQGKHNGSVKTFKKIAKVLKCQVDDLI